MRKFVSVLIILVFTQVSVFSNIEKTRLRSIPQDSSIVSNISEINKADNYYYQKFAFDVPGGIKSFDLSIENADAVLDLYISTFNLANFDSSRMNFQSRGPSLKKELKVTSNFREGKYYAYVVYSGQMKDEGIFYSLNFSTTKDIKVSGINYGSNLTYTLNPANDYTQIYTLRVNSYDTAFRVDLYNTNSDVDLYIFKDRYSDNYKTAQFSSSGYSGNESIVVSRTSNPRIAAGLYYIVIKDSTSSQIDVSGKILITKGDQAPGFLTNYPPLPEKSLGIENVLASTVSITTSSSQGSGFFISEDGYLLTSYHVLLDANKNVEQEIVIGLNLDSRQAPVEVFKARLVRFDAKKDIALLKINSGLYGQALPRGLSLPFMSVDLERQYEITTPLVVAGYPQTGGISSKPSISVTLGIVSGFEASSAGLHVKTDANIAQGLSGGPIFNAYHQAIGIAAGSIILENSQLGYYIPATEIDKSWLDLINNKSYN